MGYCTKYNLKIEKNNSCFTDSEIFKQTVEKLELGIIDYALDNDLKCYNAVNWYDHPKHMRAVSSVIKNVLFLLEGEGEESGDIWKEYYLNGKMQRCKVKLVFDEFDKNELI